MSEGELRIMELYRMEGRPSSGTDSLALSPADKHWKDNSLYIIMQMHQKKDAIREIGAIKGEKGKYLRIFEETLTREEYYSDWIANCIAPASIPELFIAILEKVELSDKEIDEIEKFLRRKRQG